VIEPLQLGGRQAPRHPDEIFLFDVRVGADQLARKLMEMGFTKVYALKGGWNEWKTAGYPVEKK
jgi:rhodanese-related sulfurtransferase